MQSLLQRLLLGNAGGGGGGNPTLNYNFVDGSAFPSAITFTRGSNATQFDSSGNLVYAPNNAIRNNTMVGAVAGTPGTLPNDWFSNTTLTGLTFSVIGTGVESGITYIDVKINGTPSAAGNYDFAFVGNTQVSALTGQTWTESLYYRVAAGTSSGLSTANIRFNEYTSGGVFISGQTSTNLSLPTTAALSSQRVSATATLNGGATTAALQPLLRLGLSGVAIDITLRIGMPQLEIGPVVTAVNATSGTAYYGPRLDYDPATLAARGLLIEEARTNSIRNNTMQGAVAGTPGTLPTNWGVSGLGTLTQQVVGTGTVNGITYIDLRFSGTTSTTQLTIRFEPNGTGGIPAANGQTWAASQWSAVIAGSLSNITGNGVNANLWDAAGNFVGGALLVGLNTTATLTRVSGSGTIATVGTAFIQPQIFLTFNSGVAIDITLRIGLPQLELGAFATSVIPTTTTALTRNADVASVNTLSPWYNASEGTIYANYRSFATTAFPDVFNISDGTNANRQQQFIDGSNGFTSFREVVSSTPQGIASQISTMNTEVRSAGAYSSAGVVIVVNGLAPVTNANATHPTGLNKLSLASNPAGTANYLNGYLRQIRYYPVRLTNAALQQITT